jgi:hypothetical protein
MAKAKNRTAPIPGVPWRTVLAAHACIHAAAAALITGLWPVFFAEYVAHFAIDDMKCRQFISFRADQALHVLCKFAWFCIAMAAHA